MLNLSNKFSFFFEQYYYNGLVIQQTDELKINQCLTVSFPWRLSWHFEKCNLSAYLRIITLFNKLFANILWKKSPSICAICVSH